MSAARSSGREARPRERLAIATTCLAIAGSCAGVALATVVARAIGLETLAPGIAGSVIGIVVGCALGRRPLAARLPADLDGWFARRRILAIVWFATASLAVVNTARIGLFVADPAQGWASMFPPVPSLARHQCLAAYVRAGQLAAHGQANLWNSADYAEPKDAPTPPTTPTSTTPPPTTPIPTTPIPTTPTTPTTLTPTPPDPSEVEGLTPYLGDPFEYPPTFVLAPRAALAITDDYQIVRAAWFGLSAVGFWLVFVALAIWIGGRPGATALLFAPLLAISSPVMVGLQFGQAHLIVVAAAIGAMMQFARGRRLTGALLLGAATASKIFPGLLLVHLVVRRQWRDLGATLAVITALVGLAALVLGPATLAAFVSEHMPRMASGEAFAFTEDNPDNHSLYGLAFKLAAIGVGGADRQLASLLAWGWTAVALVLTVLGSRGRSEPQRDAVLWLGIVCLATLRSPFAPTYTAVGTLWLLSVSAGGLVPRRWLFVLITICWILLQGYPGSHSDAVNALASLPAQAASVAIAVLAVWRRPSPGSTGVGRASGSVE